MRKTKSRTALIVVNILVIVGLIGLSGFLYTENNDLQNQLTETTQEKNQRLVDEINTVFDLPDEEPVVAIVTDVELFKNDYPAFENARSGDNLLFFRKARLNVLYRQSEKKVIQTASVVVPISVEIIGDATVTSAAAQQLAQFGNQIAVVETPKSGVTQSFVFDIDADQGPETDSIAELLGIDIGSTLPATITPSAQTEIVIVLNNPTTVPASEVPAPTAPEE